MFLKFCKIPVWPSRAKVDQYMPADFRDKYPSTRVIIDCTEIRCQMPKSLRLNSELFSSYKNHTTLKGLAGILPGGAITLISQLYTGHISDTEIFTRSGFLKSVCHLTGEILSRHKLRLSRKDAMMLCSVALDASFSCNSTQTILGRRHFGIRCIHHAKQSTDLLVKSYI